MKEVKGKVVEDNGYPTAQKNKGGFRATESYFVPNALRHHLRKNSKHKYLALLIIFPEHRQRALCLKALKAKFDFVKKWPCNL